MIQLSCITLLICPPVEFLQKHGQSSIPSCAATISSRGNGGRADKQQYSDAHLSTQGTEGDKVIPSRTLGKPEYMILVLMALTSVVVGTITILKGMITVMLGKITVLKVLITV